MISYARVQAIGLFWVGLSFTPLLHADPLIGNLACQTANGSTFSSPVYYFNLSGGSAGTADLALDLSTFPKLLSAVAAKTVYSTCELSNGGVSVTWSGAAVTHAEADATSLAAPTAEFYAIASLSYASSTYSGVAGSTEGVPGKSGK